MGSTKTVPYGDWQSPISVESVISGTRELSGPRASIKSGRAFYVERRVNGSNAIVEITSEGVKEVLPTEYDAKNSVYEYGGSPYAILPDGRIVFSNKGDTVHVLNPDTKEVHKLTGTPNLRYSNFDANSAGPWVVANQEDHEQDRPDLVRNYIAAINTETGEVRRIADTADFYYTPYFSPDGSKLVWLEWNHPDIPFDAAKLYLATWHHEGSISNVRLVAGQNREGVAEPHWGPDGALFFGKEVGDFRRLFRVPPGTETPVEIKLDGLDNAEFADLRWMQGCHTYAPLSARHLLAAPVTLGACRLGVIDLETSSWKEIGDETTFSEIVLDAMCRLGDKSALVVGAGTTTAKALYRVDIDGSGTVTLIRTSTEESFPATLYSKPEVITFSAKGSPARKIHGHFWPPHNPDFAASDPTLPPLVMISHGGPTSFAGNGLKLRTQYFTSRGYAVLIFNYAGSTGHGRAYRESLFGGFGKIDADDAAEFADYLQEAGRTRKGAVGITGISAGGYNTLCALTEHPQTFTSGVCVSGVSDLKRLDESTHKLESDYVAHLVWKKDTSEADKARLLRERSPLFNAGKIKAPLLMLHGGKDTVCPLDQAEEIADAIKAANGNVELMVVPDEGHMFAQPPNAKLWLVEEEKWWRKTLL